MDQVGAYLGNDVIDYFALEGQRDEVVFLLAVDALTVVEDPVFGEVNALFREGPAYPTVFIFMHVRHIEVEHLAVIWEGDVDIGTLIVKCFDEGG
jgi:hypothetical protein